MSSPSWVGVNFSGMGYSKKMVDNSNDSGDIGRRRETAARTTTTISGRTFAEALDDRSKEEGEGINEGNPE